MVATNPILMALALSIFIGPALIAVMLLERYERRKEREYEVVSEHLNETLSTWHPPQA